MKKYLKYFFLSLCVLVSLILGYILFVKKADSPLIGSKNTDNKNSQYSNFSYLLSKDLNITGIVKSHNDVPSGFRPTCEGEYYLEGKNETVWLTWNDSSKEERQAAYSKYLNKTVAVRGTYHRHGDECDYPEKRDCNCYDTLLVEEISPINK